MSNVSSLQKAAGLRARRKARGKRLEQRALRREREYFKRKAEYKRRLKACKNSPEMKALKKKVAFLKREYLDATNYLGTISFPYSDKEYDKE